MEQLHNIEEMKTKITVGGGAQFWAYISPQHETSKHVTKWSVTLEQQDGNWIGKITSENPYEILKTPNLSGVFKVIVSVSGPKIPEKKITNLPDSKPDVGCNSNCSAMVGIVASEDGSDANYWTVWDAFCS